MSRNGLWLIPRIALSSQDSYNKSTSYIKKALDAGGKLVCGGVEKCT